MVRQEDEMNRQRLSSIGAFEFTTDPGQRFRLVQTGSRQGRLLVRLERYGVDVPGGGRWQAIADGLHVSLAMHSAHRYGAARPQPTPRGSRIGMHLIRLTGYLRARCGYIVQRTPADARCVSRQADQGLSSPQRYGEGSW